MTSFRILRFCNLGCILKTLFDPDDARPLGLKKEHTVVC